MLLLEKQNNAPVNIIEYLQEIALYTDLDADSAQQDKVRLMTIHISKGLEFPYVFLCGFTEGVLPSALSIKERRKRAIEEERRLMYVAVTRAEKRLYMTDSEGFNFTTGLNKYPSRFLFEISEEFYIRKGKLSQEIIQSSKTKQNNIQGDNDTAFKQGDMVMHPVWNKGKVTTVNIEKNQYIVDFFEIGKEKPIDFSFRHLTLAADNTPEQRIDFSVMDLQEQLKSAPDPFEDLDNELPADGNQNIFDDKPKSGNNDKNDSGPEEKKWR